VHAIRTLTSENVKGGTVKRYDAIIIGSGQAGRPLAQELAKRGMKIALAEGDKLGGTCVNTGCSPSKTLIASARAAYVARRSSDFGVHTGKVRVDFGAVMRRVDSVVEQFRNSIKSSFDDLKTVDIYSEYASFESPRTVRVGDTIIEADRIYINTGARPKMPDISGLAEADALDTESILKLHKLPKHLIILGGGYIGVEYGQAFQRLGSSVTIIDRGPHLLSHEDEDISEEMRQLLEGEGIRVLLNTKIQAVQKTPAGVSISLKGRNSPRSIRGTHVLVALGRAPNTEELNLPAAGIELDDNGFIAVDDQLRTSADGVWAMGDVNGRGAFTHTSWDDQLVVLAQMDGKKKTAAQRVPIYAVYSDPPLGRVGMTEKEVRESGKKALMAVMPMSSVGRAIERDETHGLMKVLVDAKSNRFLGAAIFGIGGDEVIHTIAELMYADAPFTVMKDGVHIHPTVSELLPTLLGKLEPLK
jgi:pyruvate/2-oxoglutarate dehydrogenase complex dihydrolipoamide dehydrogenase (E3) component